jgi:hypothetical protein
MRRRRNIRAVLVLRTRVVVLRRKLLLRVVIRLVRVHVAIGYRAALLVLQVLILIILSPSAYILWHPLLARRQMTTVHHAGLGFCSKPTASWAGLGWT